MIFEHGYRLFKVLEMRLAKEKVSNDSSMYTGNAGTALMYWQASLAVDPKYREKALELVESTLPSLRMKHMSFLCGDAGSLALGAVLYHQLGKVDKRNQLVKQLESFGGQNYQKYDPSTANEILYGRAGFLYSLLFVADHCGQNVVDSKLIAKMVNVILDEGKLAKRDYLYYEWHDSCYVGAAHGIMGIMYILLKQRQSLDADGLTWVRKTVDWILSQSYPSGNIPSSLPADRDKLVHWCHGAPGAIYTFIEAHKVYGDKKYLTAAIGCANVIWERGFLKKGYGLCHGVSGNAYGLMAMYHYTQDKKYLKQAYLMAEWCFDYGSKANRIPDRPLSLFEGLTGAVYMILDFGSVKSERPKFPAFEL